MVRQSSPGRPGRGLSQPGEMPYSDAMPFAPYRASFDPETLQVLQTAFDMAWHEVGASPGVAVDQQAARNLIARRIVNAWRDQGERDPERLKRYAIEGMGPTPRS